MYEALLFIWLGASNSQSITGVRYDSMKQCELARDAAIRFVQENSSQSTKYIKCEPVLKVQ